MKCENCGRLKEEAIKCVKENERKIISTTRGCIKYNLFELTCITNWIKHFFNITEEDLK